MVFIFSLLILFIRPVFCGAKVSETDAFISSVFSSSRLFKQAAFGFKFLSGKKNINKK
jgi:hypothetical protein